MRGNTDVEDSLDRLDKLTREEAQMASAELLRMTQSVDDGVKGVERTVQDARDDVQDLGNRVQDVDHRVQGVDDKLDQVERSSSL